LNICKRGKVAKICKLIAFQCQTEVAAAATAASVEAEKKEQHLGQEPNTQTSREI